MYEQSQQKYPSLENTQLKVIFSKSILITQIILMIVQMLVYFIVTAMTQYVFGPKEYDNIFFIIHALSNKIPFTSTLLLMSLVSTLFPILISICFLKKNSFLATFSLTLYGMSGSICLLIITNIIDRILSSRISGLPVFICIVYQAIVFNEVFEKRMLFWRYGRFCFWLYLLFFLVMRSLNYNLVYHMKFKDR